MCPGEWIIPLERIRGVPLKSWWGVVRMVAFLVTGGLLPAWRGAWLLLGPPPHPAGAQAAGMGSCQLAPFVWDSIAGVGLLTRLGICGGSNRQPGSGRLGCLMSPILIPPRLGSCLERARITVSLRARGDWGHRVVQGQGTGIPGVKCVTNFGPHCPWVGEPFGMLDHSIPRASCFLSRAGPTAGARKK